MKKLILIPIILSLPVFIMLLTGMFGIAQYTTDQACMAALYMVIFVAVPSAVIGLVGIDL
jgi:hypothetical protein